MKTKSLKLSHPHTDNMYRVEQVTNSVEFSPGQMLTRKEADEMCLAAGWSVTICPPPNGKR